MVGDGDRERETDRQTDRQIERERERERGREKSASPSHTRINKTNIARRKMSSLIITGATNWHVWHGACRERQQLVIALMPCRSVNATLSSRNINKSIKRLQWTVLN